LTVWYAADTHFGHRLVSGLRGFASPEEHDAEIIRRWNKRVRPGDTVWHLGDVMLTRDSSYGWECVDQLNGIRHLVAGNHDAPFPGHRDAHKHQREWLDHFESVQAFARRVIAGRTVMMSHFPYAGDRGPDDRAAQFRLRDEGAALLHGHLHSPDRRPREDLYGSRVVHVGLDAWDLAPAREDEVLALLAA
jgi:calcineurin-like phosphoesterase family protein